MLDTVHERFVYKRRINVLAAHLGKLVPPSASVLDIGCGDGQLARRLTELRPDLQIRGVDVLVRPLTAIPVQQFDGRNLPLADNEVDVALLVDVLHHTDDPASLLREAARVSRQGILLKDHTRDGLLAKSTLRFMDWVGNARHGVRLPYNYFSAEEWRDCFRNLDLTVKSWQDSLGLYPWPARLLFERKLHFIAFLEAGTPLT